MDLLNDTPTLETSLGPEQTSQKPTIPFEDQTQIWNSKTGEVLKETGKKRPRTAKQLEHIDQVKSWGGACPSCKAKHRRCDHPGTIRDEKGAKGDNPIKRAAPDIGQQKTIKKKKSSNEPNHPSTTDFQHIGNQFEYVLKFYIRH
ncbi:hypothetical protein Egran_02703 [Elaphomyces granulatus]|uniref:Uncharacterized protein n=1 Tax=Elaphomyces granulatus TaxID=519963 RepID=A0A232LZD7_9EURO|nr:hypothetical protein Egran_02703 [Elaphomyces granulatus]